MYVPNTKAKNSRKYLSSSALQNIVALQIMSFSTFLPCKANAQIVLLHFMQFIIHFAKPYSDSQILANQIQNGRGTYLAACASETFLLTSRSASISFWTLFYIFNLIFIYHAL